jgi:hypothetical protein
MNKNKIKKVSFLKEEETVSLVVNMMYAASHRNVMI